MRPILEPLRARGTPLVMCSNNDQIWWPRQAKELELEDVFFATQSLIAVVARSARRRTSPRLEMFRGGGRRGAACRPRACFFVDDRTANLERAPRRFGIDAMLFRGPADFAAGLRTAQVRLLAESQA